MDSAPAATMLPTLQERIEELQQAHVMDPRQGISAGLRLRREAIEQGQELLAAWACHYTSLCAVRLERLNTALGFNRVATDIFERYRDQLGLVTTENLRGIIAGQEERYRDAYTYFHNTYLSAQEHGFTELGNKALINLSLVALRMGDNDAALEWNLQSLVLAEEQNNQDAITIALINRTKIYLDAGFQDAAYTSGTKAVAAARRLKTPLHIFISLNNLSLVLHAKQEYARALIIAEESLEIAIGLNQISQIAYIKTQIGRMQMELGNYTESLQVLSETYRFFPELTDTDLEVEVMTLLGILHTRMGEWNTARSWLQKAEALAQQQGETGRLRTAVEARSKLEEETGNLVEALKSFKLFHDLEIKAKERYHNKRAEALLITRELREHREVNEDLKITSTYLMHVADHDRLTRSLTPQAFLQKATLRLQKDGPHSVIALGIDNFTEIIEASGDQIGNELLKQMVEVIKACIRDHDMLCRWNNNEFVLLLPNTSSQQARNTCERLRMRLGQQVWPIASPITVSFGVNLHISNELHTLINEAELAVTQARAGGGDQVLIYGNYSARETGHKDVIAEDANETVPDTHALLMKGRGIAANAAEIHTTLG